MKEITGHTSEKLIAEEIGLSGADFSKRKKNKTNTLLALITEWGINQKLNINWLLTGNGPQRLPGPEAAPSIETHDPDPETADLIAMTRKIIASNTGYAHSLKMNIRSFYDAVETQQRIQNLEQRMAEMEKSRGGNNHGGMPPQSAAPKITGEPIKKTGT